MLKLLILPIEGGIKPVSQLSFNSRSVRDINFPISLGIEPERLLQNMYKMLKLLKLPIEGGIEPVGQLLLKFRLIRDINFPISLGI